MVHRCTLCRYYGDNLICRIYYFWMWESDQVPEVEKNYYGVYSRRYSCKIMFFEVPYAMFWCVIYMLPHTTSLPLRFLIRFFFIPRELSLVFFIILLIPMYNSNWLGIFPSSNDEVWRHWLDIVLVVSLLCYPPWPSLVCASIMLHRSVHLLNFQ